MKRLFSRNSGNEGVPFALLLPNLVTLTGMCLGLTSIRFAMDGRFKTAVVLILLAAVMDGLDGLIARRLNATSRLGAELDSLSDFLCFGVAPRCLSII
jgi:CDP-diacylglycerol--serine O-phosphatidyltransferase